MYDSFNSRTLRDNADARGYGLLPPSAPREPPAAAATSSAAVPVIARHTDVVSRLREVPVISAEAAIVGQRARGGEVG